MSGYAPDLVFIIIPEGITL